jgi:tRNA G18 (ribose-2'-O)-methylase SpoU
MVVITSANDTRIEAYRHLHGTPHSHTSANIFIAEGTKTARALLKSKIEIISVFALPEYYQQYSEILSARNLEEHQLFTADKAVMNEIVGFRLHEGIMAIGIQPPMISIEEITFPTVALCGIVNSENVGAIIRNCAAFGVRSVIVDSATSSPYLRRAVRVSMGAVFCVDIYAAAGEMVSTLLNLQKNKAATIISAEISDYSQNVNDFIFSERPIIIFGSEGKGLPVSILEVSDSIISIPIESEVDSLNVAAASSVILYELYKSRY